MQTCSRCQRVFVHDSASLHERTMTALREQRPTPTRLELDIWGCSRCDIALCADCWRWHRCGQSDVCPDCKGSGLVNHLRQNVFVFSLEALWGPPEPCPTCTE